MTEKPTFKEEAEAKPEGALAEFLHFALHTKKWWLTPILLLLALMGVLIVLGGSGVAPFIYTLF